MDHSPRATWAGLGAIGLWSLLAWLTAATAGVPPFLLTALTFGIGGLAGLVVVALRGRLSALLQPPLAWVLGVGGLFGYHAAYFAALKLAPPAEVSLVNYLWPLLIVLFTGLLPGERLTARHSLAAVLGFAGVAVLAFAKGGIGAQEQGASGAALFAPGMALFAPGMALFAPGMALGYLLALAAAFIWAGYSVLSRRMAGVPTDAVAGFCLATAVLAFVVHLAVEASGWPAGAAWLAILALGLGPVGAAFFLWDQGMKRGDIRLLGLASYATPVVSTLVLILAGQAQASAALLGACGLIVAGAMIARDR